MRVLHIHFWIRDKGITITNSCYHYGEHVVLYMQTYDVVVYTSGWGWTKPKHCTVFQPKTILRSRWNGPHFAENIFKYLFFDYDICILIQIWSIAVPKWATSHYTNLCYQLSMTSFDITVSQSAIHQNDFERHRNTNTHVCLWIVLMLTTHMRHKVCNNKITHQSKP